MKNNKSAVEKYKDFTGKLNHSIEYKNIKIPKTFIEIGIAYEIAYKSDKYDGIQRHYVHKLKKQGKIYISPEGDLIMITDLKLNIKPEGLTG